MIWSLAQFYSFQKLDPIVYLDDDCTSCSDVDECDAAIVAQSCYNRVNCGDPGIMLRILNTIFS